MPITPLHLAAALPVKHAMKNDFSLWAFIIVNCIIDLEPITVHLLGLEKHGLSMHGGMHTIVGVTLVALVVSVFRWRFSWWLGAAFGAYSHLFMDAMVHADMRPLIPLMPGNPLYLGLMEPMSLVCLIVVAAYGVPWLLLRASEIAGRFSELSRRFFKAS